MNWKKTGREVYTNGEATTFYQSDDRKLRIESRKRAIPHANGVGAWMHTTYFLIRPDGSEKEYYALRDAKAAAEG